jgi:predicted dehydrogenase
LGTFSTIQSTFKTKEKTTRLLDAKGEVIDLSYQITSPDIILVQGVLEGGAAASFQLRTNKSPADGVGSRWIISGTEGELVYTSDPGFFHMGTTGGKITLKKWTAGAEEINFQPQDEEYSGHITAPGINILRLYEAFAQGKKNAYASIEDSLETQRLLDKVKQNAAWAP